MSLPLPTPLLLRAQPLSTSAPDTSPAACATRADAPVIACPYCGEAMARGLVQVAGPRWRGWFNHGFQDLWFYTKTGKQRELPSEEPVAAPRCPRCRAIILQPPPPLPERVANGLDQLADLASRIGRRRREKPRR